MTPDQHLNCYCEQRRGRDFYLRRDATQTSRVSSAADMHACGPSDVIVLENCEGEISICNEHCLESVYLRGEEQTRLKHFLISSRFDDEACIRLLISTVQIPKF